jgi:hypothetical protein
MAATPNVNQLRLPARRETIRTRCAILVNNAEQAKGRDFSRPLVRRFSSRRHSGMVRKDQTRNLEIPGSMLAHRPGMTDRQEAGISPGPFVSFVVMPRAGGAPSIPESSP